MPSPHQQIYHFLSAVSVTAAARGRQGFVVGSGNRRDGSCDAVVLSSSSEALCWWAERVNPHAGTLAEFVSVKHFVYLCLKSSRPGGMPYGMESSHVFPHLVTYLPSDHSDPVIRDGSSGCGIHTSVSRNFFME